MAEIKLRQVRQEKFVHNCPNYKEGKCTKIGRRCNHPGPLYVDCAIIDGNNSLADFMSRPPRRS